MQLTIETMITEYTAVSPAYGRDYKNRKEAEQAFRSGVDFKLESMFHSGAYCSIRDFAPGTQVEVRYARMEKCAVVTV